MKKLLLLLLLLCVLCIQKVPTILLTLKSSKQTRSQEKQALLGLTEHKHHLLLFTPEWQKRSAGKWSLVSFIRVTVRD
jgi:hypothetical protein